MLMITNYSNYLFIFSFNLLIFMFIIMMVLKIYLFIVYIINDMAYFSIEGFLIFNLNIIFIHAFYSIIMTIDEVWMSQLICCLLCSDVIVFAFDVFVIFIQSVIYIYDLFKIIFFVIFIVESYNVLIFIRPNCHNPVTSIEVKN